MTQTDAAAPPIADILREEQAAEALVERANAEAKKTVADAEQEAEMARLAMVEAARAAAAAQLAATKERLAAEGKQQAEKASQQQKSSQQQAEGNKDAAANRVVDSFFKNLLGKQA